GLIQCARETLANAASFCELAERAARGERGRIRIGLPTSAAFFVSIQHALRSFQQEYPDVALELSNVSSGEAIAALQQRSLDLCLIRSFPNAPLPTSWNEFVVERDRLMLVLPARHRLARSKRIPLAAVASERFISLVCKRGIALQSQIMHLWENS